MKIKHFLKSPATLLVALFLITPVKASQLTDDLYDFFIDGASLRLGVGTRQAGLKVIRKSDDAEGKVVQRDEEAYFINYSTKPAFLKSSPNFGYTFMFNLSSFNANQQETSKDVYEDLGTRASGEFIYVVPTAFYQWGEHRYEGKYTRIGIGLGLGLMRYNGDIILDGPSGQETLTLSDSSTNLKIASSFMLESRWNHWGIMLSVAGPTLENDLYTIQIEDFAVNLGYSFVF